VKDPGDRYYDAAHAVQAGTKLDVDYAWDATPEGRAAMDCRIGLNVSMAEAAGLVELLIAKGLITEPEYTEAITLALEREKARLEAELAVRFGHPVVLA
jgi:hypothetical protein